MRAIPQAAVAFVREAEALRLSAYLDSGGVWTIGYGHVGPEVTKALVITKRQADLWLKEDLTEAAQKLYRVVKEPVISELTDNQYAALLSFVLNLGAKSSWTIWKVLNARNFDGVPAQMIRFVYDQDPKTKKPRKVAGLVNRRTAEIRLWSTDEPGSVDEHPSSGVTRLADTPPAVEKPKAGPIVTAAVSACAAVPVAAKQVTEAIAPYSDASPLVGQIVAGVATLAACSAIAVLGLNWLQHRNAKQ